MYYRSNLIVTGHSLSVVIPHFNQHNALKRCLKAISEHGHTEVEFEVIVVDNGSRYSPRYIVAEFAFARLDHEPTPGPGPARNRGVDLSQGEILVFIDADCCPRSDWIPTIASYFSAHPEVDVIGGDVGIQYTDPESYTAIEAYESVFGYRMPLYIHRDGYAATCNMAVRRETFMYVGKFASIGIAEDVDWGRRATAMDANIKYVPEMKVVTPARANFAELARKWDRHIAHDYAKVAGTKDRVSWCVRAIALVLSPIVDIATIFKSDRLSGLSDRLLAFRCLTAIRLYRSTRMLCLIHNKLIILPTSAWRQDG